MASVTSLQREMLLLKKKLEMVEGVSDGKCSIVSKSSMEASLFSSAARKFLGVDKSDADRRSPFARVEPHSKAQEEWLDIEEVSARLGKLAESGDSKRIRKVDKSQSRGAMDDFTSLGKRRDFSMEIAIEKRTPSRKELSPRPEPIQIDLVETEVVSPRKRGRPKKDSQADIDLKNQVKELYKESFGTRRKYRKKKAAFVPAKETDQSVIGQAEKKIKS
jgi:hypothetical protein